MCFFNVNYAFNIKFSAINNLSTTDTVKLPIETEGTSAAVTTTMQISAININPSIVAREPTALDLTSASYNPSTGTEMHINDSIMPSPFEVSTVSASQNDFHQ